MFSLIKNSILGMNDQNNNKETEQWVIKYLYGCSDKENVLDALIITGSQNKANLAARTYLVEQAAIGISPLWITLSGVCLYINPANPNPTKLEHVVGAWAEPCPAGYQKHDRRYSDSECLFSSINVLARAVLSAQSAGTPKTAAEHFNIYKLHCGPRSKDREHRILAGRKAERQEIVRLKLEEYFIEECHIKKAEFQNINAMFQWCGYFWILFCQIFSFGFDQRCTLDLDADVEAKYRALYSTLQHTASHTITYAELTSI
ncbi:hypothetical protein BZA77DRAFT_295521 [Pyronema omphalodes]|nr:hypothetical protein BZA77DRAFT_295521 [Pyronema omphalodes]